MVSNEKILYCRCKYARVVPAEVKDGVLEQLTESGVPFHAVPDLCEMTARRDPALKQYSEADSLKIIACYPRAVQALFHSAGAPLQNDAVKILNMRAETTDEIMARLNGTQPTSNPPQSEDDQ